MSASGRRRGVSVPPPRDLPVEGEEGVQSPPPRKRSARQLGINVGASTSGLERSTPAHKKGRSKSPVVSTDLTSWNREEGSLNLYWYMAVDLILLTCR